MRVSPDGTEIAFSSDRDGNDEIYVVDIDGTGLVNLTHHPADDMSPGWSPDGSRIAFSSFRDGRTAEVYVMDSDGENLVNLTNHSKDDRFRSWSSR